MPAEPHVIQLEPFDDAVSVRDRLTFVKASRVVLVWPANAPVLRRKLDLLLVLRQANRLQMRLALVTSAPEVIEHARELNISVFEHPDDARRAAWKRPHQQVFIPSRDPARQLMLADHILEGRWPPSTAAGRWRTTLRWILFLGGVLAILVGFFLAAPSATITLTPASRQVFETVTIVADPELTDIDIEQFRMPATVVTLQATSHVAIETSGRESAGATLAQGLVVFTNLTDDPILIPLGTIVSTSSTYPIRFETLVETTLPAGNPGTVQVPIQALEAHAGTDGNVRPGAINRVESELDTVMEVTNPNATYGGAIEERQVVTAQDHERLLTLGRQQVLQRARDTLLYQLSGDQFLVPGSLTIVTERPEWTIFSALVGDVAASVSLDLRAEVQAVIVDEQQARQLAYAGLAPYVQPGLEIAPGALTFSRGDILDIAPNGRVTFVMTVSGSVAVSIDEQFVRERTRGLTASAARHRLESELLLDPARPPRIDIWPGWYNRLPWLPVRITVHVNVP